MKKRFVYTGRGILARLKEQILNIKKMGKKINVAQILKDCPKGMELDCLLCNSPIALEYVAVNESTYPIKAVCKDGFIHVFTKYGEIYNHDDAKCVIFPKGKTTWAGFVHRIEFKNGDVIYVKDKYNRNWCSITDNCKNEIIYTYVDYCFDNNNFYLGVSNPLCYYKDVMEHRLATEEEKQKLFEAIKANGYKWNTETKTLEKLVEPKFKIGDRIRKKGGTSTYTITDVSNAHYFCGTYVVCDTCDNNWELVPNKFDVTTLKPFDRVLVRDNDEQMWTADMFSFYNEKHVYAFMCIGHYTNQCIPYDQNKHLLGTTKKCDDYYKNWE